MKLKFILFILFLTIVQSCMRRLPDEELTIARKPNTGKEIRIDGYYSGKSYQSGNTTYITYIFFFSNGVVYTSTGYDSKIKDINEIIKDLDRERNSKDYWSVFQIENDTIHEQGWTNSADGFIGDYRMYSLKDDYYKIINDTTLLFERTTGYITSSHNDYYYFKEFSPKPDSTNFVIK